MTSARPQTSDGHVIKAALIQMERDQSLITHIRQMKAIICTLRLLFHERKVIHDFEFNPLFEAFSKVIGENLIIKRKKKFFLIKYFQIIDDSTQ